MSQGRFHIWTAESVSQALEGNLHRLVAGQLATYGETLRALAADEKATTTEEPTATSC